MSNPQTPEAELTKEKEANEKFKPIARRYETGKIGFYQALHEASKLGITELEREVERLSKVIEVFAENNAMIMGYFEGYKFLSPGEKFAYETAKNSLFNALNEKP